MKLRTIGLISTLALGLLAAPLPGEAQQAGKMLRLGYLSRKAGPGGTDKAFRQTLRDLGWIEGKNITIEYRWAAYKMDRLSTLAEELVRLKVDLIVTATQPVTQAAKYATTTIPIVMMYASDTVENGHVASLMICSIVVDPCARQAEEALGRLTINSLAEMKRQQNPRLM